MSFKLDYGRRQDAIVAIGHELERRGWKLYGYSEDRSDMMTDYYCPAHWAGVATHDKAPGVVVGVGVSDYHAKKSGQDEMGSTWIVDNKATCTECNGTGVYPGGLTLEEARQNPTQQHAALHARKHNQVLMFATVVSPLGYHSNGDPMCLDCHGKGYKEQGHSKSFVRFTWPKFHETPKGRAWHVEKDNKIMATGTGFMEVYLYRSDHYGKPNQPAIQIVDQIEAVAFK